MTAFANLIDECRDQYLYTGTVPEVNRLATTAQATDTSLTFSYALGSMAIQGQMIDIDLERIRVWATSGQSASPVDRGVFSSTPAVHEAGAVVEVNARFSQFRVANAINEDLAAVRGLGLYRVGEEEFTYNAAIQGYDLGTIAWDDIIDVRYEVVGPSKVWPLIRNYDKLRLADTTQFPSGNAIVVREPGWPGLPVRVRYKGPFSPLVNLDDDVVTVTGLPSSAVDIPPIGAAIRLAAGGEISRNSLRSQREPSLLAGVPPGAVANSPKNLMVLYAQRINAEAANLARLYPKPSPR